MRPQRIPIHHPGRVHMLVPKVALLSIRLRRTCSTCRNANNHNYRSSTFFQIHIDRLAQLTFRQRLSEAFLRVVVATYCQLATVQPWSKQLDELLHTAQSIRQHNLANAGMGKAELADLVGRRTFWDLAGAGQFSCSFLALGLDQVPQSEAVRTQHLQLLVVADYVGIVVPQILGQLQAFAAALHVPFVSPEAQAVPGDPPERVVDRCVTLMLMAGYLGRMIPENESVDGNILILAFQRAQVASIARLIAVEVLSISSVLRCHG